MSSNQQSAKSWQNADFRAVKLLRPQVEVTHAENGTIYISQAAELPKYGSRITERLEYFAKTKPDQIYLADRGEDGEWRKMTYAEAYQKVRSLSQFFIDQNVSVERPIVILSGNDLEHALVSLAATHIGVPSAPISPAYSLVAKDYARLKDCIDAVTPAIIFTNDVDAFAPAIAGAVADDIPILTTSKATSGRYIAFKDALNTPPSQAVDRAFSKVDGSTIAKFLFTSGSTGSPKAVINTHEMICSNAMMTRDAFTYFEDESPILLDWAPWNHTAGGNKVFYMALFNGGTLYVDDGSPRPADIHKTVRNLKEVSPTWYFNVPKGYEALVAMMEDDEELRKGFYKNLKLMWYAGASMAQHTWDDLERLSVQTIGKRVVIGTGLGATETAPGAIYCTWPQNITGNIGLPVKGLTLKLVPMDGKYDARVKAPTVTPGYWRQEQLTKDAFDEEGYYMFGDALRAADPEDYNQGFIFDGRTAENFKLNTGTWVATGALRNQFINHFGDVVNDVTITGADESFLGALVFPNHEAVRKMANMPNADIQDVLAHADVRDFFQQKLQALATNATGSSTLIRKLILVDVPPSLESNELTDKGSVNQRAVLNNRPHLIKAIYSNADNLIAITK
ncbi:MAG: feruloyl-CoA synthase [Hyphomicrobiales bacterium]|nr:MAG: feruloyl-CoA synthase [Hyphomicrobiales bacterium]